METSRLAATHRLTAFLLRDLDLIPVRKGLSESQTNILFYLHHYMMLQDLGATSLLSKCQLPPTTVWNEAYIMLVSCIDMHWT